MIVDLFLVYQFIKRLATPFEDWDAYELGIIDEKGNILKKSKDLRTVKERDAWGKFDVLVSKIKKLLEKVPGGSSRLASYAAALWLIKENAHLEQYGDMLTEEQIEDKFNEYYTIVQENTTLDLDYMFEQAFDEDVPINSAGSGNIAGIGIGPYGEPGVSKKAQRKYKKKNKPESFRRTMGMT